MAVEWFGNDAPVEVFEFGGRRIYSWVIEGTEVEPSSSFTINLASAGVKKAIDITLLTAMIITAGSATTLQPVISGDLENELTTDTASEMVINQGPAWLTVNGGSIMITPAPDATCSLLRIGLTIREGHS